MKILFLIHDLGQGGAEKVLVNLVNNMDREKFDITVMSLFGGGVNEQFLGDHIRYKTVFPKEIPGNSHIMKLFSPSALHRYCVKEHYDVEVAYLEGPSSRVISGCPDESTKLVSWIHSTISTAKRAASSFRSLKEAKRCYCRMDRVVFVSKGIESAFCSALDFDGPHCVLYNTVESDRISELSREPAPALIEDGRLRLAAVGTLKEVKGYDRLLRIVKRLKDEARPVHLYILGKGPQREELENYIKTNDLEDSVTLLGYDTNPYKYVSKCAIFVCSSYSEGFSTAATEALIVGTPVCTVEVSGMKELLGENNEYGIVTENSEDGLYGGIKMLMDDEEMLRHYREKTAERGGSFGMKETVGAAERMLEELFAEKSNGTD